MDVIYFFIGFFLASIIAICVKLAELTEMNKDANFTTSENFSRTNEAVNNITDRVNQISHKIPMSVNEVGRLD